MKRLNVTLALDEDLLQEACAIAARRHTSVNEMIRQYLSRIAGQERQR